MDEKYISLIAKYLSGELEDKEREMLFELVNSSEEHKSYFEEMQNLWEISGEEEEDFEVNTDVAWSKVAGRINSEEERPKTYEGAKVFRIGQLLKIAAVLVGVLSAVWMYNNFGETPPQIALFETQDDERKEIKLPDGSTVWLNENSKLTYDESFEPRIVDLEGEAFFDVEHLDSDHKFEIQSGDAKTTVLGTSFNVRAYPQEEQVEVTVETGRVVFEEEKKEAVKKEEKKVFLTAGESGVYKKKEEAVLKPKKVINNAVAWKKKQLAFDDIKISEVITALERYFDVEVEVENKNILDCTIVGTYPDPSIDSMVLVLEAFLGAKINHNENKLTFVGGSCK